MKAKEISFNNALEVSILSGLFRIAKMKILITLIALAAIQLAHAQVPAGVPWTTANGQITQSGIMAVTCGVLASVPVSEQYTFGLKDVRAANLAPMPINQTDFSKLWHPPVYHHPDWTLSRIGNVFGICFDTDGDIYVSASSSYNNDYFGTAGLVRYGQIGGGANSLLAAGTIYKIDKTTGIPTVFCQLPQQATVLSYAPLSTGTRTTGPGLGDVCYDAERNQFFVSNFEDGKIYRISATGAILDSYDPFVADNGAAGAAPENERVWALQVSAGRLYFSTWRSNPASGPSALYSVAISALGTPSGPVDLFHLSVGEVGGDGEIPIMSDIAFNAQGDMLVAERSMAGLTQSYNHESRVYHFKKSGSSWITSTISPGKNFHEGYGGADWGYDGTTKEGFIWASSADMLWEDGPHGVQGWRIADTPVDGQLPWSKSVMVPFMPASQNPQVLDVKGFGGDLEIYKESCIISVGCTSQPQTICTPANGSASVVASNAVGTVTYLWSSGETTSTISNKAAGMYTVTVTDGGAAGCSSTCVADIVNNTVTPTVTDPADQTVCAGASTTAVTFAGSAVAGTTYSWTNNTTSIGLAANGTGNITAFTATNATSSPVTATITVTPTANGCTGTAQTFTILVNPTATAIAVSGAPGTCTGSTPNNDGKITLIAASNADKFGVSTGSTYSGTPNYAAATTIGTLPQDIQTAIPNAGGTYTIRLFNGADDCFKDTTIVIAPVSCSAPCTSTTSDICPGDTYLLDAGAGLTSIQWFKDNVAIPGANAQTYMVTEVGSYHFTANLSSTGCNAQGCCPAIFVAGNCTVPCPPKICLPVQVVRN